MEHQSIWSVESINEQYMRKELRIAARQLVRVNVIQFAAEKFNTPGQVKQGAGRKPLAMSFDTRSGTPEFRYLKGISFSDVYRNSEGHNNNMTHV